MGSTAYAFSVHNFINSVGADAGFAAIIGLAILVLLYFAQARETASLRENAKEAAARIMELERRLAQLGQAQAAAQAQPRAPGVAARPAANPIVAATAGAAPAPISAAAVAAVGAGEIAASHQPQAAIVPGAPAGVGAPALTAATRMISTPAPTVSPAPMPAAPAPFPVGVQAAGAPATAAAAQPAAPPYTNGTGEHVVAPPRPAVAAASAEPQARPPVQGRPGGSGARATTAARSGSLPPRGPAPRRRAPGRLSRWLVAALVALGAAAVIVGLVIITSSGSSSTNAAQSSVNTPTTNAPAAHHAARPKPFNPATVTVAVLNGTPVAGLAGRMANRLVSYGFKQGPVATAGDQTRQATIVAYMPGHSKDAAQVAKALKLGSASVQPLDQSTQSIACQGASPCTATVVVTVGADLQSQ